MLRLVVKMGRDGGLTEGHLSLPVKAHWAEETPQGSLYCS